MWSTVCELISLRAKKPDKCGECDAWNQYKNYPRQRWIPCNERLPEYGIQVLTTDKDGDFELNHIVDEDDGTWYWSGAIAWMPLPEPYEVEHETD